VVSYVENVHAGTMDVNGDDDDDLTLWWQRRWCNKYA